MTDGSREPVEGAALRTTIEGPDGKKQPLRLDPEPGGYGESFTPTAPGRYRVEAAAEKDKVSLGQDAVDFIVQAQDREMRVPYANLELLKAVAEAAHGRSTDLEGLPWNSPWVLGLFWLFLAGEWLIRRWKGFF